LSKRLDQKKAFFEAYLINGIALVLAAQVFINVGVNIGLLPTKGLTLPFLSYGGSSLLVNLFMLGIVLRIDAQFTDSSSKKEKAQSSSKKAISQPSKSELSKHKLPRRLQR
jgi:cell division protein FtsW